MKLLARQEPQALVSLLLPGAKFLGTIDKELQGRTVEADLLFRVIWCGVEIITSSFNARQTRIWLIVCGNIM